MQKVLIKVVHLPIGAVMSMMIGSIQTGMDHTRQNPGGFNEKFKELADLHNDK